MTDYDPQASRDALRAAAEQFLAKLEAYDFEAVRNMMRDIPESADETRTMNGWHKARIIDAMHMAQQHAAQIVQRIDALEGKL